ncbi:MAG: serine/threonine protein kinase [Planctomycetes bacterium]|nr:serine/threonine protein kinase [Planctomycetota bacterium]
MSENGTANCDEKTLVTVLLERDWATSEQIETARMDLDMGLHDGPLEKCLLDKNSIIESQYNTLLELCTLPDNIAGFNILSTIGAGAMGVVYLAEEGDGGAKIALKVINSKHCDDQEFIKRFHRETKAVSDLDHDHIAKALGSGKYKDQLYLAMEFIDGPSLAEILEDHGPVAEPYALRCVMQIAKGLDYAFDKYALVHRDIKPANILIRRTKEAGKENLNLYMDEDSAQIIDFGLAKETGGDDDLTMTGMTMGTPHYMAPEQIKGETDINQQVDIYALGATLFHLLTGEPPYTGNSPGAIMLAHINNPIPNPADIIPSIKEQTLDVVKMCLAKDKKDRFGTYKALLNVLEDALKECGIKEGTGVHLLRKPLKLSGQTRAIKKKKNGGPSPSSSAATVVSSNDAETMAVGSDSWEQEQKKQQSSKQYNRQQSSATYKKGSSEQYLAAESALRRIQTEHIRKESTRRIGRNDDSNKRVPTKRFSAEKSAAFEENPIDELGSGRLPWLILSAAVVILLVSIASRLF